MADVSLDLGWAWLRLQELLTPIVRALASAARRLFETVFGLIKAFGEYFTGIKLRHDTRHLALARLERDRLFREPVRLNLPDSQRARRVGRAASLSGAWRLAAA